MLGLAIGFAMPPTLLGADGLSSCRGRSNPDFETSKRWATSGKWSSSVESDGTTFHSASCLFQSSKMGLGGCPRRSRTWASSSHWPGCQAIQGGSDRAAAGMSAMGVGSQNGVSSGASSASRDGLGDGDSVA